MTMIKALLEREASNQIIKVGIVGAGQMGEGLVCQMETMHGMKVVALAATVASHAEKAYVSAGIDKKNIISTDDIDLASSAIEDGKKVATAKAEIVCSLPCVDIVIEATGVPEMGAKVAVMAIAAHKHILQMNVETDATVGYILRKMANEAGVIYTLTGGDEPGACMDLYDFTASQGFDVVAIGKGKNNPLDYSATPDSLQEIAQKKQMNPKMLCSFVDGTKTMVEMTALGNGIGYTPDIRGMHGANANASTLSKVFCPKSDGGILSHSHVVDFCKGVAPGVFLVFTTKQKKLKRDLEYLLMGPGPYYTLYRPYHLTSLETPFTVARTVIKNETTLATDNMPVADTITVAKCDLKAGQKLDGFGGFSIYGSIETADITFKDKLLPMGIAPDSVLKRDVKKGQFLTLDDVELNLNSTIVDLRRIQDGVRNGFANF